MSAVVEIAGLRKEYRRRGGVHVALDGLDLQVRAGRVFGFLGPNGSGKTTTIRCLLGLVRPTAGRVRLFGRDVPGDLAGVIGRVGAIVETPQLFPTMSGRRNLTLLAATSRIGSTRVDAVLERVGLLERADDLVRSYSLGMRQRLGLAAALLKDPALVVLDEPANGLDPGGMRDVRHLLRELAAEGRTVFVSSHLLGEISQTCDDLAILRRGRCVASGTVDEVLGTRSRRLVVRVPDLAAAATVLRLAGWSAERREAALLVSGVTEPSAVNRALADAGIWLDELRADEASLEDLFLELTADPEPRSLAVAP